MNPEFVRGVKETKSASPTGAGTLEKRSKLLRVGKSAVHTRRAWPEAPGMAPLLQTPPPAESTAPGCSAFILGVFACLIQETARGEGVFISRQKLRL